MPKQLVLEFPVEFPEDELENEEVLGKGKEAIVLELFITKRISSGYAANLLGLCLADFMELLKERGIPFAHYTKEDLERDRKTIVQYEKRLFQEKKGGA